MILEGVYARTRAGAYGDRGGTDGLVEAVNGLAERAARAVLMSDFYLVDELLTDDERRIRETLRAFCDAEVLPIINDYWERAEFPFVLLPKIAELGLAGGTIQGYGCPGMTAVAAGLVSMEWARADGSMGTFFGVHSNLAMQTIAMLGSEEQKERWLPAMADLAAIGAFALTEPDHGSDAVLLETQRAARRRRLRADGAKRWIGNASFADVVIVWARDEEGKSAASWSRRTRRASTRRS